MKFPAGFFLYFFEKKNKEFNTKEVKSKHEMHK